MDIKLSPAQQSVSILNKLYNDLKEHYEKEIAALRAQSGAHDCARLDAALGREGQP